MSNIIDSIRLSGTTYQIQGSGGGGTVDPSLDPTSTNPVENKAIYNKFDEVEQVTAAGLNALNDKITPTVELTQAEYDALTTKDPNTFYVITDAEAGDLTNYYTKSETNTLLGGKADTATTYTKTEVDTALGGKQATLISGTNIKTINNESILGSGNIDIQGGSVDVDSALSPTSENPVENRVIYNKIDEVEQVTARALNELDEAVSGKVDTSTYNTYTAATDTALASKQTTLTAGINISIVDNVISATGGGLTEDDELLLATALTGLNDRKIDASEVKSNYQKKGDYATKDYVATALEPYETKANVEQVEEVTAYALNDLNQRFGGLKIVKITESEYAALTTKDENTLYIVVADPS